MVSSVIPPALVAATLEPRVVRPTRCHRCHAPTTSDPNAVELVDGFAILGLVRDPFTVRLCYACVADFRRWVAAGVAEDRL